MTFLALSYVAGATIAGFSLAEYLRIAYIPGAEELGVFCSAIFGAGVAFHPPPPLGGHQVIQGRLGGVGVRPAAAVGPL